MAKYAKQAALMGAAGALMALAALPSAAAAQDRTDVDLAGAESVPGKVALNQGNAADAVTMLEEARRREGNDPAILINLAQAYALNGDYDRARSLLVKARDSRRGYDMMLSTGNIVSSRDAAVAALDWLAGMQESSAQ